jgi:hypothetical protein
VSEQTGSEDPLSDPVGEHLGVGADPEPGRDPEEPSDLARPRPEDDDTQDAAGSAPGR